MEELELPEGPVLELLNAVSMAKRMANMVRPHCFLLCHPHPRTDSLIHVQSLHSEGFGKKQENNRKKNGTEKTTPGKTDKGKGGKDSAQAAGKGGAWKSKGGASGGEKKAKKVKSVVTA